MGLLTPIRFCTLLFLCELLFVAWSEFREKVREEHPFAEGFLVGDSLYYAAAAESLGRDGDWDLRNQLQGPMSNHQGFIAISVDGRVVPKHSTLLPLLSFPFFLLFGVKCFLFFNCIQVFLLILGIGYLAGNSAPTRLLALVAYLSTPFLAYTYNFSPDVLATALLIWSYVFGMRGRPLLAGLIAGLAIWAKIYFALFMIPLALIVIPQGWRASLRAGAAALAGVAPMLLINAHLFGSPWIAGYDRDARITGDGTVVFTEHYSRFNQPLVAGFEMLLFDERIGLLRTAPLWFLWPAGVAVALRRRPLTGLVGLAALTLAMLVNLFVIACYDEQQASEFGNRFLFPALALGFAVQGPLWERYLKFRSSSPAPS